MKINKILLKIAHLFRYRLNEEHQDDITINIPTVYPKTAWNNIWLNNDCSSKDSKWVMDDILNQVSEKLKSDPIFEKRCRNVGQVWTTFYTNGTKNEGSIIIKIPYIDGELCNPCEKGMHDAWERHNKLRKLLNE